MSPRLKAIRGGQTTTAVPEGAIPPHDLDAEAAVLAAVIVEESTLDRVQDVLKPEDFYAHRHALVFEAVLALRAAAKPIDVVTVATWLRDADKLADVGGMPYLTELLNAAPSISNARVYAATVREKWRLRELAHRCELARAKVYCREFEDAQSLLESTSESIAELSRTAEGSTVEHAKPIVQRLVEGIRMASEGRGLSGTPTGYAAVDRLTKGLVGGEMTVLGARPSMGKSALAVCIAANVAASEDRDGVGNGVLFLTMEMPKVQVMRRAVCSLGSVNVGRVKEGKLSATEWQRVSEASVRLAQMPLWVDDRGGLNLNELRTRIRQTRAAAARRTKRARLRLVVVDYLQLMRASEVSKNATRESIVSECARGLKALALGEEVAILALAQLNREIDKRTDKRPGLSDLRESGEIEQAADNIAFLYRADYYDRKKNPVGFVPTHEAELNFAKVRDGEAGLVKLRFEDQYTRFEDCPEWQ